jgi:hypothetical protein
MPDIVELDGSPPRVAIERVVPALSSPLLHGPESGWSPESFDAVDALEPPSVGPETLETQASDRVLPESSFAPRRSDFELAAVVAVAISLAGGDIAAGFLCGAALGLTTAFRRVPFSFAEGFLGYRPDMGWPHGVQEDDDFHWNWKGRKAGR